MRNNYNLEQQTAKDFRWPIAAQVQWPLLVIGQ
jgi:hypothetical protein